MRRLLSVENMRKSDARTIEEGTAGGVLMYRAAIGIKLALQQFELYDDAKVLILCGSGNNAGDGYALANILYKENVDVALCLTSDKLSSDGRFYYEICQENQIVTFNVNEMDIKKLSQRCYEDDEKLLIIDCLLGTGFKGKVREPLASLIENVNYVRKSYPDNILVVSVDINSGLNGDSGLCEQSIASDYTISIGDLKPGLFLNKAKDYVGEVINVDIGIEPIDKPFYLMDEGDVARCIPIRYNDSNKGTHGYVALIGGSLEYSGAACLASNGNNTLERSINECLLSINGKAAMRQGAGVVMLAAPKSICPQIAPRIMESTLYPLSDYEGHVIFDKKEIDKLIKRVRLVAFGMGIGKSDESKKILAYLIEKFDGILLIDADGLNCLSEMLMDDTEVLRKAKCKKIILTPHLKEFERLSGFSIEEIKENIIELAKGFAKENNVVVLLKGPSTVVTDGDEVILTDKGCPGMATAGSGDVLSGILAAICGYNASAYNKNDDIDGVLINHLTLTVAAGAYINGYAGELAQKEYGSVSMIASDTVEYITKAIQELVDTVNG